MPQSAPKDEKWLLRRLAELEKRVRALETSPRAGNTSISGGQLTVGAPDSADRIEIDANTSAIRFYNPDGPAQISSPGGAAGISLEASQDARGIFPSFGASGYVWNGTYFQSLQTSRIDGDTTTVQAAVDVRMSDAGAGHSYGQVTVNARSSGAADSAVINLFASGGLVIDTGGRTSDPPAPAAGSVVLYAKANRLYYRDGGGTVRGPL